MTDACSCLYVYDQLWWLVLSDVYCVIACRACLVVRAIFGCVPILSDVWTHMRVCLFLSHDVRVLAEVHDSGGVPVVVPLFVRRLRNIVYERRISVFAWFGCGEALRCLRVSDCCLCVAYVRRLRGVARVCYVWRVCVLGCCCRLRFSVCGFCYLGIVLGC